MDWKSEDGKKLLMLGRAKVELAEALGWPLYDNLSWFRAWPGGWCLHGRPSVTTGPSEQKSMNFDVPEAVISPWESIRLTTEKVLGNRERLQEMVRWFCKEHEWEQVLPRGEMNSGCPKCGGYYCEPWLDPEAE